MELIKEKIEFVKSWVRPLKSWATPLKSWAVGRVGRVGRHFWPSRWRKITAFFRRKSIDDKIAELERVSGRSVFVGWNESFQQEMYFIENPFTEYGREVVPVGFLDKGKEEAVETALMYVQEMRDLMLATIELSHENTKR